MIQRVGGRAVAVLARDSKQYAAVVDAAEKRGVPLSQYYGTDKYGFVLRCAGSDARLYALDKYGELAPLLETWSMLSRVDERYRELGLESGGFVWQAYQDFAAYRRTATGVLRDVARVVGFSNAEERVSDIRPLLDQIGYDGDVVLSLRQPYGKKFVVRYRLLAEIEKSIRSGEKGNVKMDRRSVPAKDLYHNIIRIYLPYTKIQGDIPSYGQDLRILTLS